MKMEKVACDNDRSETNVLIDVDQNSVSNVENYNAENNDLNKITYLANDGSYMLNSSQIKIEDNFNAEQQNEMHDHKKSDIHYKEMSISKAEICYMNNLRNKPIINASKDCFAKPRYGATFAIKSAYQNKLKGPKRKLVPSTLNITNASAKVVLFEKKVEIKDLESQVKYLQNQIKELKIENKTLLDVQSRQERELKKFKEGVADIPSLLKSHKEEMKVVESTLASVRKELRDAQKELKVRNEYILKKNQKMEKQSSLLKQNEKLLQDHSYELKEFKILKQELEDENKNLLEVNKSLRSQNEDYQKKIQELSNIIVELENSLNSKSDENKQYGEDLSKQKILYDELEQKYFESLEKHLEASSGKGETYESSTQTYPDLCLVSEEKSLDSRPALNSLEDKIPNVVKADKVKNIDIDAQMPDWEISKFEFNGSSLKPTGVVSNNLKPLPPLKPLKQHYRKYSHNNSSLNIRKEQSSCSIFSIKSQQHADKLSDDELFNHFEINLNDRKICPPRRSKQYNISLSKSTNQNNAISSLRIPWLHDL